MMLFDPTVHAAPGYANDQLNDWLASLGLRDYQQEAVRSLLDTSRSSRRRLVVMATGLGKTHVFVAACGWRMLQRDSHRLTRPLILVHRIELAEQAARRFRDLLNVHPTIIGGESIYDPSAPVVIAMVQTLCRKHQLRKFQRDAFDPIVVDECHHAVADSYRRILAYFGGLDEDITVVEGENTYSLNERMPVTFHPSVYGVTATPDRADEVTLGTMFDEVVYEKNILDGIDDGWLVPLKSMYVAVQEFDLSSVRCLAGDFKLDEVSDQLTRERPLLKMAQPTLEACFGLPPGSLSEAVRQTSPDDDPADVRARIASILCGRSHRPTIVFTSSVAHAWRFAEILNRWRQDTAVVIDGTTPAEVRSELKADYEAGRIPILVNCMVATEGFDLPLAEIAVMARPTTSRALYSQMLGRVTRPSPDIVDDLNQAEDADTRRSLIRNSRKPFSLVIDFVGNVGKHSPVHSAEILAPVPDDLQFRKLLLAELARTDRPVDPQDTQFQRIMAEVQAVHRARAREEEVRKAGGVIVSVDYVLQEFPEFGEFGVIPIQLSEMEKRWPATSKQVDFLKKHHVKNPHLLTKRHASQLITAIIERSKTRNLPTAKQLWVLHRFGVVPQEGFTRDMANTVIDYIARYNWRVGRKQVQTFAKNRFGDFLRIADNNA